MTCGTINVNQSRPICNKHCNKFLGRLGYILNRKGFAKMADNKQRRDYGSGSISQRSDGTWTVRMVIGVNEKRRPRIKALYGKTEREVKRKLKS